MKFYYKKTPVETGAQSYPEGKKTNKTFRTFNYFASRTAILSVKDLFRADNSFTAFTKV